MAIVRAIPRSSFALILSALIIAASISFGAVYTARGDNHDQTFYACLYAGSLSQVNTSGPPASCGRGSQVQWTSAAPFVAPQFIVRSARHEVPGQYFGPAGGVGTSGVNCEPGEVATGGGGHVSRSDVELQGTFPKPQSGVPYGWDVSVNSFGTTSAGTVTVYVICMAQGT